MNQRQKEELLQQIERDIAVARIATPADPTATDMWRQHEAELQRQREALAERVQPQRKELK